MDGKRIEVEIGVRVKNLEDSKSCWTGQVAWSFAKSGLWEQARLLRLEAGRGNWDYIVLICAKREENPRNPAAYILSLHGAVV